ncbi:unconventional prefoldin RPB5 interactor-like protein isoform X2 [Chelonus insularis]|nr:unconventional prefoldin RPB5 interactor-like protein isoform X2 [Chelonus insularis]
MLTERLKHNNDQTKWWNDYKKRHEKVIEGLQILPQDLSSNCMVPIGKRALMKGKLTHTNEIMVCLGDGYFAKYSASQAIALCERRIKRANEMLEHLEKEKNLFEMRQLIPNIYNVFENPGQKDIIEYCEEKEINDWRNEHRQREKEYRKKLAELKNTCKQEIQSPEDLFKKLDALELQEELEDELIRLEDENQLDDDQYYDESEVDSESYSSDYSEEATNEVHQKKSSKVNHRLQILNSVNTSELQSDLKNSHKNGLNSHNVHENDSFSSTNNGMELTIKSKTEDSTPEMIKGSDKSKTKEKKVVFAEPQVKYFSNEEEMEVATEKRRVSVIEQRLYEYSKEDDESEDESDEDETIRIYFKHSDKESIHSSSNGEEILSPRDIYKIIPSPKSILKKTSGDIQYNVQSSLVNNSASEEESNAEYDIPSAYESVVKDVKERVIETNVNPPKTTQKQKLVSKFKLERAGLKK